MRVFEQAETQILKAKNINFGHLNAALKDERKIN